MVLGTNWRGVWGRGDFGWNPCGGGQDGHGLCDTLVGVGVGGERFLFLLLIHVKMRACCVKPAWQERGDRC